jgi:hypothetical protein
LGDSLNTNATGDIAVKDNGDGTVTVFVLATNNGLGAYTIGDPALPVEMAPLAAFVRGEAVELRWETATERGNAGWEIERRISDWEKVGFVEGGGNSNVPRSYAFVDHGVSGSVVYRLRQIDRDGSFTYSNEVEVTVGRSAAQFELMQNYPNPFNAGTKFGFRIADEGLVTLTVYDVLGREVATVVNQQMAPGSYVVPWDADGVSSGIYFCTLRSGLHASTKKLMLAK